MGDIMKEKKNIPEIRFEGFVGEWVKKRLEDFCSYHSSNLSYNSVIANGQYELYDANGVIGYSNDYFLDSDYITIIKDGSGVGRVRLLPKNTSFIGTMGAFKVKDSDIRFLLCCLLITDFSKHVIGATIPHIYFSNYGKEEYFVPSIEEQSQIGSYFQNLDKQITLEQQKHVKLVTLKKAMLEKMFPKEGASVPEIRFEGFENKWNLKKLSELTNYKNGVGNENNQSDSGKYELINLNSISINGGLKHSGKYNDETESTLCENDLVMILSDVGHGDLLGRVAIIPENDKYVLNQRVALLRPNNSINPKFLFYNINANQYYFKLQGAGMSQLNISRSSVENFMSYIPIIIIEQSKIGTYFQNLDKLISLQQQKIDKLKNIKKACLDKMFV